MKRILLLLFVTQLTACGGDGSDGGESMYVLNGKWQWTGKYCDDSVNPDKCDQPHATIGCASFSPFFNVEFNYTGTQAIAPVLAVPTVFVVTRAGDSVTFSDGRQFRMYNKATDLKMAIVEWNPNCRMEFQKQ